MADRGEPLGRRCATASTGTFADLETGERIGVRERLSALLDQIEPFAVSLGAAAPFAFARSMVAANGADQRARRCAGDARGAARWLTDRFLDGC